MDFLTFKNAFLSLIGVIGASVACFFGGLDKGLQILIIFMFIDYVTGVLVAGVFGNSKKKNSNGKLVSCIGWKGLIRKVLTVVVAIMAHLLDDYLGTSFIQDLTVISFLSNELISIVENLGLCGVPIPKVILKAIDILNEKANKDDK